MTSVLRPPPHELQKWKWKYTIWR